MRRLVAGLTALTVAATVLLVVSPADAATRYAVTAYASTAKVDVGQSFTLSGKVTPKAKGQRVLVQRFNGRTWTTIQKPVLNRYSRYKATVKVTAPRDNRYRVVKPRSNGHPKGISPTRTVVAWRWRSITSLPTYGQINNATLLPSGQLGPTIFPATYRPLIRLGSPSGPAIGSISYLLAFRCTAFDAHVGVTPASASGNFHTAIVGVIPGDGMPSGQIAGQSVRHNQDAAHIIRTGVVIADAWALNLYAATDSANTYVAWGDAKVYCRS